MESILITSLSVIRSERPEEVYTSDVGEIVGRYSMDAPTAYFLKKLHLCGEGLDRILCLATPETLQPQTPMPQSAFAIYRTTVEQVCASLGCPVPAIIPVTLEFGKSDMNRTIHELIAQLPANARIFLDTTGGARNTSYILLLLTRFLAYKGSQLQQAVYGNYQSGNTVHSIEDVTMLYNMFSLINAANTFTAFGNATELQAYFQQGNREIRELLEAMVAFSDAVMLCDTCLEQRIASLRHCFQQMQGYQPENDAERLFLLLMDTIQQKLYLTEERSSLPYPELIRWCMENSLIQQAVTIYTEKMPEYLFKEGILKKTRAFSGTGNNGFSEEYTLFYMELYNLAAKHAPFQDTLQAWCAKEADRQAFHHCRTLQDFFRRTGMEDTLETDVRHVMIKFIQFKNCLFNAETCLAYPHRKRQEKLKSYPQYPEFQVLFTKTAAITTMDKFLNFVLNHAKFATLLEGNTEETKRSCKPETIRHLERYLTADCGLAVAEGIPFETFRQFLTITLFIKTSLRNTLNHASDQREEGREDFGTFFEEQGYRAESAKSVKEIRRIIAEALGLLEELQGAVQERKEG